MGVIMSKENVIRYPAEAWDILQHLFKVKSINDHTLHFAAKFSGHLDSDRLSRAVDLSAEAFPLIRCGFNENGGRPFWEDHGYTSADMVNLMKTDHVEENALKFLCRESDAANGPQLKVGIMRSGKNDTLCITINHMLCDAAGFKDYLYLLSSIYNGIGETPETRPAPAMNNRKIKQVLKALPLRDRLGMMFRKGVKEEHDKTTFGFKGNPENPFIEMRTIPRERFRLLRSYAKAHGATVNDVMLAALIRVLHDLFGQEIALPCTMDLRKYLPGRRADGICNLVTNLTCDIGPDIGASFNDTLARVSAAMNREKANVGYVKSLALLETVFQIFPYATAKNIVEKVYINAPIAFTNIGILDKERLRFGETEMTGAYMTGSVKYSPYFQLAISTFDDEATFSVNLYGTASDREKISLFCDKMGLELQNAAVPA
jgi:Uncharacterized protein containing a NRPS condensation (elongation) domain